MTPHLEAAVGDYADIVLLPGDPDRAIWISRALLDEARCVNRIRGALGFTGTYRGVPVSIQTTGMGQGSFAIYANELVSIYGARTLIRIGSCGSLSAGVRLRETVAAERVVTDIESAGAHFEPMEQAIGCSPDLLARARRCAARLEQTLHVGATGSSDHYYHPLGMARLSGLMAERAIAIDMETHALYSVAARFGVQALSLCTVVDSLVTSEEIERRERQAVFGPMTKLALEVALETAQR